MGDWEERIAGILNDPEQMAQIQEMARSLMGEGAPGAQPEPTGGMAKLSGLLQSGGSSPAQELLRAMKPYLSQKRQGKLERALRIARVLKLAGFALKDGEHGETL